METKSYYTLPFVCFGCRKSFKKSAPDFKPFFLTDAEIGRARFACPQCKQNLHFVGRYFKTPRFCDLKQWRKVGMLYEQGWRADGYHLSPQNLRQARAYSATRKVQLQAQQRETALQKREKERKLRRSQNANSRLTRKTGALRAEELRYQDAVLAAVHSEDKSSTR